MVNRTLHFGTSWGAAVNLLLSPSAFDAADWTKGNVSVPNVNIDGTGDGIVENTANDFHTVTQNVSKDGSAITYNLSVRAKRPVDPRQRITLQLDDNAGNGRVCVVDIQNGEELGVAPASYGTGFSGGTVVVTAEADSWFLCELNGVTTNSATTVRVIFALDAGGTTDAVTTSYLGNGTSGMILDQAILVVA
jgi:hypothetical protein